MEEWKSEPNWLEFEHVGFKCLITRESEELYLCGYAGGIPEKHPYYGKSHKKVDLHAHRGLTFGSKMWDDIEENWREGWWFGFECNHPGDLVPVKGKQTENDIYRNIDYVTTELKFLAEQLAAAGIAGNKDTSTPGKKKIFGLFRK
jgi:hypothetical protein